jgi:hypothetical protein
MLPMGRVAKLVEFSPNERLFTLGHLLQKYRINPHFCSTVSKAYVHISCINDLQKMGVATYILADFFTNSSGHPAHRLDAESRFSTSKFRRSLLQCFSHTLIFSHTLFFYLEFPPTPTARPPRDTPSKPAASQHSFPNLPTNFFFFVVDGTRKRGCQIFLCYKTPKTFT